MNYVGKTYSHLTVTKMQSASYAVCKCSCGEVRSVYIEYLISGHMKSCGCRHSENLGNAKRVHGKSNKLDRTYTSWQHMKARCNNPKNNRYDSHGGRGIVVCKRWQNSFENFLADMGERSLGKNLERLDNDGNYEPGNCVWATPVEQASNMRSTKFITYVGVTDTHAGWARRVGISPQNLCKRLQRGWSIEDVLKP